MVKIRFWNINATIQMLKRSPNSQIMITAQLKPHQNPKIEPPVTIHSKKNFEIEKPRCNFTRSSNNPSPNHEFK
jgi:hypothetical protein